PVAPAAPKAAAPAQAAPAPAAPGVKLAPVIGLEIDTSHPLADDLGPLKVDMPRFLTFSGTSSPGSSYTFFANPGIQMIESGFSEVTVRHLPGGTRANVERVGRGEAEIGVSVGAEVGMATTPYKAQYEEAQPVRTMAILPFKNGNMGLTLPGSGFETFADWTKPGFRLGGLYAGSATYRFAFPSILSAHGVSYESIKDNGGVVEPATGDWKADNFDKLFGGRVDAIEWHGPIPDAFLKSQEIVRDVVCIGLTDDEMETALAVYPGTAPNIIPAGTYKCNEDKDIQAFGYTMVYIVNAEVPNETVYNLLWSIYRDDGDTIRNFHPQNAGWDYIGFNAIPSQQTSPWHPGAKMYWEARGLTIPPQNPPPAAWVE
ncbi:MAG: TAXI family TRAP transporter solute-binding subunit, partial [Dehalococcoidia bacterium]|nr:TAXI family TRAP transporter solute-binding subunit [Dehalococcoidia bacterium]